jgi:hypothetical protein
MCYLAVRIRMVADPKFASGTMAGLKTLYDIGGLRAWYFGRFYVAMDCERNFRILTNGLHGFKCL